MDPIKWMKDNGYTPYNILGLEEYQGKLIDHQLLRTKYIKVSENYHPEKLMAYGPLSQPQFNELNMIFCALSISFSTLENCESKLYYDQTGNYLHFERLQQSFDRNPWLMYSQGIWSGANNNLNSINTIPSSNSIIIPKPLPPLLPDINNTIHFGDIINTPFDLNSRIKRPTLNAYKTGTSKAETSTRNNVGFIPQTTGIKAVMTQFSTKNGENESNSKMQYLQRLYDLPNEHLHDESLLNKFKLIESNSNSSTCSNENRNQRYIEHYESEIDNNDIITESEVSYESYKTSDNEYEEKEEDDDDDYSYASEYVPLDYQELAARTKEKQYLRGRELAKKFDKVISDNNYYQPPSEIEFKEIQNRLLKRQKKKQVEHDYSEVKKNKKMRIH